MKRTFLLKVTTAAAVFAAAGLSTGRTCQYCRQAYEDPEAGRMVTDNRGGSFPLNGSLGQYQAVPPSADLKTAPAPDSVATSASALTVPGTSASNASAPVVHRPVLPPPPSAVVPVKVSALAAKAPTVSPDRQIQAATAHWADVSLLGLAAAGGVFCWRTRRKPPVN